MNYLKTLKSHGLDQQDIDKLSQLFSQRAAATDAANRLPDSVYQTAAIDFAMGAIDLAQDTREAMQEGHDARHWLQVLTGVTL